MQQANLAIYHERERGRLLIEFLDVARGRRWVIAFAKEVCTTYVRILL